MIWAKHLEKPSIVQLSGNQQSVIEINRNFSANLCLQKLHCDTSYVKTETNIVRYICSIIDAFNQEVVNYNLSRAVTVESVLRTLALLEEILPKDRLEGILLHTDQGVHFVSYAWHEKLEQLILTLQRPPRPARLIMPLQNPFSRPTRQNVLELSNPKPLASWKNSLQSGSITTPAELPPG